MREQGYTMLYIFFITNAFSNIIRIPVVDIQPTIYLPKCSDELGLEQETSKTTLLMGNTGINRDFSLEFSVNYFIYTSTDIFDILKYYELKDTLITLKRYRKKIVGEKHKLQKNKPVQISLPNKEREIHGFNTFFTKWTYSKSRWSLKRGCQLISIYMDYGLDKKCTKQSLIETIKGFRKLVGLENKSPEDFAFQFFIKIKRKNVNKRKSPLINISTFTFKLVFNENGYEVKIEKVDKNNYQFT